jgi:carbohydrate diacid regulator
MLRKDLAASFIERLAKHIPHNINVMDESGTIVASTDRSRVDTFHESAYRIIQDKLDVIQVRSDEPLPKGTKPGVNLPIRYGDKAIGVVGVTGRPEEVLSLAHAVKTAVETMLDHELYKDKIFMRQDKKNLFLNLVLYEKSRDLRAIEEAAKSVDYSQSLFRVPVIFVPGDAQEAAEFLQVLKKSPLHTKQDVSCVTVDNDILVFKVVKSDGRRVLASVRSQVREYVDAVAAELLRAGTSIRFAVYAGSRVRSFLDYSSAYEQARWLVARASLRRSSEPVFFDDQVEDYLLSKIPHLELHEVFSRTLELFRASRNDVLLKTIRALFAEDRNLQRTARRLGIHRNTVYQRLQKLKDLLGIDLLESPAYGRYFYHLVKFVESGG